jgi:hypothetical protein
MNQHRFISKTDQKEKEKKETSINREWELRALTPG